MTHQPPTGYGYGQPAQPSPGGPRPGGLLDRFLARLVDYLLLAVVNTVLVSGVVVGGVLGARASGGLGGFGPGAASYAAAALSSVISALVALAYFAVLESSRGQTIDKMAFKLRTTGPDGQNPTLDQAVRRNIFTAFGVLGAVPLIGWLGGLVQLVAIVLVAVGINSDTVNRQAWHDHFAGETRVWKIA